MAAASSVKQFLQCSSLFLWNSILRLHVISISQSQVKLTAHVLCKYKSDAFRRTSLIGSNSAGCCCSCGWSCCCYCCCGCCCLWHSTILFDQSLCNTKDKTYLVVANLKLWKFVFRLTWNWIFSSIIVYFRYMKKGQFNLL